MKNRFGIMGGIIILLLQVVFILPAYAQNSRFALSAKAGSLGLGMEGLVQITPHLNGRVGANAFQYDYNGTESDIKYDIEFKLLNFSGLLDWFPSQQSGFRLTAGLIVNENSVDAKADSSASYTIGDTTYTAGQVGSLTGSIDFNKVGPYLGVGWGNPFGKDKRWSFSFDLGAFYQGTPEVDLSANGTLANNATFLNDLAREEDDVKDKVKNFKFYPVLSLGLTYRF